MLKRGKNMTAVLKKYTAYEKKLKKRWDKIKKDLKDQYSIDVEMMGYYKKPYLEWLEDQYCDLSTTFHEMNEQRTQLIAENIKLNPMKKDK